jgi:polyhydroxyalkanoate synthesis regulator phasin
MKNCTAKALKDLRSGRGELVDQIQDLVDELVKSGEMEKKSDTLVVAIERRRGRSSSSYWTW